ncbi:hypothetical protein DRO64_09370, partial [Candidatus Bathyarchaeota archaeon]
AAAGGVAGWLLHDYFANKPETPGVDLDSYAEALFHNWIIYTQNKLGVIDFITDLQTRMDLYYIRRAEYNALDYLNYSEPPMGIMKPVVSDLCYLQKQLITMVIAQFQELDNIDDNTFIGDLSSYSFSLDDGAYVSFGLNSEEPNIKIVYELSSDNATIWSCELMQPVIGFQSGDRIDLGEYLVVGGSGTVKVLHGDTEIGAVSLGRPGTCLDTYSFYENVEKGIPSWQSMIPVLNRMVERFAEAYWQAWNFAVVYHQSLRSLGYTDRTQVPLHFICPPPDVAFYDLNDLAQAGMSQKDIASMYLVWMQQIGEIFDQDIGCLMGNANGTISITVTETATITTVVNGTTTTTVVISHQIVTPDNIEIPDVFTRLKDVQICINGTCFNATWVAIIDALTDVSFKKGQPTVLENPMRVLIEFPNGTKRIMDLTSGTTITPGDIITHSAEGDVSHDEYTYRVKPMPYWMEKWWNYPEPHFVEPADKNITALIQLVVSLMPLIILLAVIQLISSLGKRR